MRVELKAARLVAEQRVYEIFRAREYSTFWVEGKTKTYQVDLWTDGTMECTCPYWTYKRRICSHILASQLYHNQPSPEVSEEPEPELSLEESKQIIANAPDIFDNPEAWYGK